MPIRISLSRVLAFISPIVATVAATAATWLTVHVHLFATFHVAKSAIASAISQAVVFGVTAVGTYLMQHRLLGHFIEVEKAAPPRKG
jgi:hypothetical protein